MSDYEYDLYYHDEFCTQYNSNPTPKRVHTKNLASITLSCCDSIQGQTRQRRVVKLLYGSSSSSSSSSDSFIIKRAIPKSPVPTRSKLNHIITTVASPFDTLLEI